MSPFWEISNELTFIMDKHKTSDNLSTFATTKTIEIAVGLEKLESDYQRNLRFFTHRKNLTEDLMV